MKPLTVLRACTLLSFTGALYAQDGPFPPEEWPASADGTKVVHFGTVDFSRDGLGAGWEDTLSILSGGDQQTVPITIDGLEGVNVTGNYFNVADFDYPVWNDFDTIDILLLVYGNASVLAPNGNPRDFNFLVGTVGELTAPFGGSIPVEGRNNKWNWVLFSVPNDLRPSGGGRYVGFVPEGAQGNVNSGGVNGGTIRIEGVPGLTVHAVAFGEAGAFGTFDQVNRFALPDECEPEPNTNLAFVDIANETSQNMVVLDDGDQPSTIDEAAGPEGDKRRAVRAEGSYLNFAVTDDYLGAPCAEPRTVKICLEYYDDPALEGNFFGPESYATDDQGGTGFFSLDQWEELRGTGQWIRRSFTLPQVSLFGVGTAPLTGGPRFEFDSPVAISRFDLAVLRTGDHPLAGIDPLADCVEDPGICSGEYGFFAELDLANGVSEGLALGSSGGDQEMIEEEAGPDEDRRPAIRAAFDDGTPGAPHQYINFAITDEVFGPTSQPNARLAICITYWDNPELIGESFRPEAYRSVVNGTENFAFFPGGEAKVLEGTGAWQEAYFEIAAIKFSGVNQGPQAAARFLASDKIHISRVRYGVIRECGPTAGINPLAECVPESGVCAGEYGFFAELDLANDVSEGLALGSSGGDQEMVEEEAGPVDDRRPAIRPALDDGTPGFAHNFLNFAITDEVFGPTSQPNARLAVCLTYWDNPELAGASFRPEVYRSVVNDTEEFAFFPEADAQVLEGTGAWREAYFEIPDIKFSGVNQGPQAAARFLANDKIHISRVRYGVIRDCGPTAGINPLAECVPEPVEPPAELRITREQDGGLRLAWPAADTSLILEETNTLGAWDVSTEIPVVEGEENVVTIPAADGVPVRLFRLNR